LGEPKDIDPRKGPAVQLASPGSVTLWSRDLASDKINDQEVVSSTSQVAQEDLTHFVERPGNQRESQNLLNRDYWKTSSERGD